MDQREVSWCGKRSCKQHVTSSAGKGFSKRFNPAACRDDPIFHLIFLLDLYRKTFNAKPVHTPHKTKPHTNFFDELKFLLLSILYCNFNFLISSNTRTANNRIRNNFLKQRPANFKQVLPMREHVSSPRRRGHSSLYSSAFLRLHTRDF